MHAFPRRVGMTALICVCICASSASAGRWMVDLPESPKPWEATAARELSDYLAQVLSNGTISVSGSESVRFHVGDTEFAGERGLLSVNFKDEEWLVKSFGGDVALNGGGTRGCLYAVYRFLEDQCGVRWWADGDEDVPNLVSLDLPRLDDHGQPHFFYREIYRDSTSDPRTAVRNRVNRNGDSRIPVAYGGACDYGPPAPCHNWERLLPFARYGKEHPEWFSLKDGKRVGGKWNLGQLCLSCPGLVDVLAGKVEEMIAKGEAEANRAGVPAPRLYDISQNDNRDFCQCGYCRASQMKHGVSGDVLRFENAVAARLGERHPGLLFTVLAYDGSDEAPEDGTRAVDNLVVRLCNTRQNMAAGIFDADNVFMCEQLGKWGRIAKNLMVWEYAITFGSRTRGFPFPSEFYLGEKLKYYSEHNVKGLLVELEGAESSDFHDLKFHLLARFLENPTLDAKAVICDFMRRYYGPAARDVLTIRRRLDKGRREKKAFVNWFPKLREFDFLSADELAVQDDLWNKAEAAVADDPKRLRRVRRSRMGHDALKKLRELAVTSRRAHEAGVSERPFFNFAAESKAFVFENRKIRVRDDAEASTGKAVYMPYVSDNCRPPLLMGLYSNALKKDAASKEWEVPENAGYRWYELDSVQFPEDEGFVYLTRSWCIQVMPLIPELDGAVCSVKARVKFAADGVYVDRVVVVPERK